MEDNKTEKYISCNPVDQPGYGTRSSHEGGLDQMIKFASDNAGFSHVKKTWELFYLIGGQWSVRKNGQEKHILNSLLAFEIEKLLEKIGG